jgi:hypothetical protein
MKFNLIACSALAMVCGLSALNAAETKEIGADEKKKAEALIKDLGADEFQTRESAEKGLAALGGNVLPLVRLTAENTADPEIKTRCERVIKILALDVEVDPAVLSKIGKEQALAKHYADAMKYYAKAELMLKEQAAKATDEKAKDLLAAAKKASERKARAQVLARMAEAGENGQDQAQGRVRIAGGMRVVVRAGGIVEAESATEDGDW